MRPEVLDYELLAKAYAWLEDRAHWTKGSLARGGKNRRPNEPHIDVTTAQSTCAMGALAKAAGACNYGEIEELHAYKLLNAYAPRCHLSVMHYNDARETTHADILSLFRQAMKKAKQLAEGK